MKIVLLEDQASESKVFDANLLVGIDTAREVASIATSQLRALETRQDQLRLWSTISGPLRCWEYYYIKNNIVQRQIKYFLTKIEL